MSKKKKDKEEIRIPHFRAPADKLDLDVLNVGGILHSGRVVNSLRVDVSQESEINLHRPRKFRPDISLSSTRPPMLRVI